MNVVFLPALASSLASAVSDGVFCDQWTCLFGWVWSFAALMLLSAWLTHRWSSGNDSVTRRLMPVGATSTATLVPQLAGLASPTRHPPTRPKAVFDGGAGLTLRGPPTTDMAAPPPPAIARRDDGDGRPSSPSLAPTRSTGTPCPPASDDDGGSGQPSPV
jgi:hypothetical protein